MRTRGSRGVNLLAFLALAVGVLLLLSNFLLLSGFNATSLWPLLLVIAGVVILFQGDITDSSQVRPFGITRGTVESGTLEMSAGEIDVVIHDLAREGRLAAGQYAADSRPALDLTDTHATLRMNRNATPWLSFGDWDVGLAQDLPWDVFVSTSFGQVSADLSNTIVQKAVIATGIGDIRLTAPNEAFEPLILRSAVGDLHVYTPAGTRAIIYVNPSPFLGIHANMSRYTQAETGEYVARNADYSLNPVEIHVSGTFGEVYLA
ncbi:MAG: hypothetical protein KC547_10440 [Anaerolineae bacterium]|nr:hypothetical protein [Anaerolineae bacterium]